MRSWRTCIAMRRASAILAWIVAPDALAKSPMGVLCMRVENELGVSVVEVMTLRVVPAKVSNNLPVLKLSKDCSFVEPAVQTNPTPGR